MSVTNLRILIIWYSCRFTYINKRVVKIISKFLLKVQPGTFDLIILICIFIGLQAWWIIPIIKKNNKLKERGKDIKEEIQQLERIFKK